MLKKITFALIFFVIGAFVGGFSVVAYGGYHLAHFMVMIEGIEMSRARDWAFDAYMNEPPETGIWAMEKYLDCFNELFETRLSAADTETDRKKIVAIMRPESSWVDYVRLAILYEKIENMEKRDQYIQKAIEIRGYVGENIDEIMINMVKRSDAELNEN